MMGVSGIESVAELVSLTPVFNVGVAIGNAGTDEDAYCTEP